MKFGIHDEYDYLNEMACAHIKSKCNIYWCFTDAD